MVLRPLDYAVILGYLVAITLFGSWFAKFQKTTRDYFLADRSAPWWAICFTIVATETSTLSFIGVPASAYTGNMTFLQLAIGYIIGRLLVSAIFLPAYFRGDLVTSYELLQRRFGTPVKTLASGIFLVTRSLADGIRLFATALVIAVVTGVPVSWTVILLGAAMIVYTVRGGAAAVIWTDVVQMFVYLAGAWLVFVALLNRIPGGWAEVVSTGAAAGKFVFLDLTTKPTAVYTLWAGVAGGVALTLATHGTQFTLFLVIGIMMFAYYQHIPPPAVSRADEILPRFVVGTLTGGMAGFIVAAIVAAALSPSLNSMAAATVNDFYKRYINPGADDRTLLTLARRATIAWGIVQIGVALGSQLMNRSVLDAGLSVLSLASGPVLGAFLVGVGTRRVTTGPMMIGMITGIAALTVIWWTGVLAWTWYALTGAAITGVVAIAASAARPRSRTA